MDFKYLRRQRDPHFPPLSEQIYEKLPDSPDPLRTPHTPSFCLPLHLRGSSAISPVVSPSGCVEVAIDPPASCSEWEIEGGVDRGLGEELQPTVSTDDWPRHTTSGSQPEFISSPSPEDHSGCSSPGFASDSPLSSTQEAEEPDGGAASFVYDEGFAFPSVGPDIHEAFSNAGVFYEGPMQEECVTHSASTHAEYMHSSPLSPCEAETVSVSSPLDQDECLLDSLGFDLLEDDLAVLYATSEGREKPTSLGVPILTPSCLLPPIEIPRELTPGQSASACNKAERRQAAAPTVATSSLSLERQRRPMFLLRLREGMSGAARMGAMLLHSALKIEEKVLRRLCSSSSFDGSSNSTTYGSGVKLLASDTPAAAATGAGASPAEPQRKPSFSAPLWGPLEGRWRQSKRWVCWGEVIGTFCLTLILFASALSAAPPFRERAAPRFLQLLLLKGRLPLVFYAVAAGTGYHFNPALLYAGWLTSPNSRSLAFTNLLVFLQYAAAAAAAAVVWGLCGGSGRISAAFAAPSGKVGGSLPQLAAAEATLALLVCLAYLHLRSLLKRLTPDDSADALLPLKESSPTAAAEAAAEADTAEHVSATAVLTPAAAAANLSTLMIFRGAVMVVLLLLFAALHPPSPTGLNPAVAYTAAWLSKADEFAHPSAAASAAGGGGGYFPSFWGGARSWLSFFVLFSFAPYLGTQIAAILWCRFLDPAAPLRWQKRTAGPLLEINKRPLWEVVDSWLPPSQSHKIRGDWLRL